MIPYFQQLGELIECSWLACSYSEEAFPRLVLEILQSCPPGEHVDMETIADWAFDPKHVFRQPNHRQLFGEPPIMLFQGPRFYIEALFWLSATTDIHEHAFSGAFVVLAGASVHSHWSFSAERVINSRMICGRLDLASTEVLRPGDVRPIVSGERLIHQLFHLEVPSVTLVVRTYEDRNHLPQYKYLPPGLAIDPEDQEGLRTRRLMLLGGMARGEIKGLRKAAFRMVDEGDLETIFYMFSLLTIRSVEKGFLRELYSRARSRHGEIVDFFQRACEAERRTRIVVARRSKISNPAARFLLALLMLMPDRDAIFAAVAGQFPGAEPLDTIEACVSNIAGKDTIGFDFNDVNRLVFRGIVEGLDAERLLQSLGKEFLDDSVGAHHERLLDHASKLAKSDLFFPLFSESPFREARAG